MIEAALVQRRGYNGEVSLWRSKWATRDDEDAESLRSRNSSGFSSKKSRCLLNILLVKPFTLPGVAWLVMTCLSYSDPTTAIVVGTSCRWPKANRSGVWRQSRTICAPREDCYESFGSWSGLFLDKRRIPYSESSLGNPQSSRRATAAANHHPAPNLPQPNVTMYM